MKIVQITVEDDEGDLKTYEEDEFGIQFIKDSIEVWIFDEDGILKEYFEIE